MMAKLESTRQVISGELTKQEDQHLLRLNSFASGRVSTKHSWPIVLAASLENIRGESLPPRCLSPAWVE